MVDATRCPQCGQSALVERRAVLESTDGPVEHCKVTCVEGHWFVLPVSMLADEAGSPSDNHSLRRMEVNSAATAEESRLRTAARARASR
jgi:hypothetical protein